MSDVDTSKNKTDVIEVFSLVHKKPNTILFINASIYGTSIDYLEIFLEWTKNQLYLWRHFSACCTF